MLPGSVQAPQPAVSPADLSASLALRVERQGSQLLLTWNRDASAVKDASSAALSIWDGKQFEKVTLEAPQFRRGSIVYSPLTGDVSFLLEIFGVKPGDTVSEHVRVLGGKPSPMAAPPEPEPAAEDEDETAEAVADEEPGTEAEPARRIVPLRQFSLSSRITTPSPESLPEPPPVDIRGEAPKPMAHALPAAAPPPPEAKPATPPAPVSIRGGDAQEARLLKRVEPVYPPLARQARVSGAVRVQAVIDKQGRIGAVRAVSGHPLLRTAATDAVSQWVYTPAKLNGQPTETNTTVDIAFNINSR
jgi:protein TonB